jgi:chemotaxis protein methyltransferase CheR
MAWNIPELRLLLESIVSHHAVMEAYEVEQDFPGLGRRTMLLNARKVFYDKRCERTILLSIEDITERRAKERESRDLLRQKEVLLQEMQHRVANNLQIIASVLRIKARTVRSEETRLHLHDAHSGFVGSPYSSNSRPRLAAMELAPIYPDRAGP